MNRTELGNHHVLLNHGKVWGVWLFWKEPVRSIWSLKISEKSWWKSASLKKNIKPFSIFCLQTGVNFLSCTFILKASKMTSKPKRMALPMLKRPKIIEIHPISFFRASSAIIHHPKQRNVATEIQVAPRRCFFQTPWRINVMNVVYYPRFGWFLLVILMR